MRQFGAKGVDDYFGQAYALTGQGRLRWLIVEGDSTDDTADRLTHYALNDSRIRPVKCTTGKPKFGSVVSAERFAHLATVFNSGLASVDLGWSDYVMFIPGDVLYQPDLCDRLIGWAKDLIAPMFWAAEGNHGRFYDIWGFRRNGQPFPPHAPAWYDANLPAEPVEMDTVGGCIMMRKEVIEAGCRYTAEEVDHGLCKMAQERGFSVWCDPTTHIVHI